MSADAKASDATATSADAKASDATATTPTRVLRTVVFLGSARNIVPAWGGDKRLGDRVFKYVLNALRTREEKQGGVVIKHEVTVYDPLVVFGKGGALASSGAEVQAPVHWTPPDQVTAGAKDMATTITKADCFVIISTEYNHSPPPALTALLDHFGPSCFGGKPSAVITYSGSPFGGARAAMTIQPLLHELGCLPVSKMAHLPTAHTLFDEDGKPRDENNQMLSQVPGAFQQLEWMAVAMKNHRAVAPEVFGNN